MDQFTVVMKLWSLTLLLDHRLTAETLQLLAELPKNLLAGEGKQLMVFCVTVGFVKRKIVEG